MVRGRPMTTYHAAHRRTSSRASWLCLDTWSLTTALHCVSRCVRTRRSQIEPHLPNRPVRLEEGINHLPTVAIRIRNAPPSAWIRITVSPACPKLDYARPRFWPNCLERFLKSAYFVSHDVKIYTSLFQFTRYPCRKLLLGEQPSAPSRPRRHPRLRLPLRPRRNARRAARAGNVKPAPGYSTQPLR